MPHLNSGERIPRWLASGLANKIIKKVLIGIGFTAACGGVVQLMPKTAMASSKLLLAALKQRVAVLE